MYSITLSEEDLVSLRGMLDVAISVTKSAAIEDAYRIHKLLSSAKKIEKPKPVNAKKP